MSLLGVTFLVCVGFVLYRCVGELVSSLLRGATMADQLNVRFYNLPGPLTPLIGREQEIQAVCTLLRQPEVRLVNLTGTGGVGKTRLSLQVASDLLVDFADGVFFVPLAPISNPDLVI